MGDNVCDTVCAVDVSAAGLAVEVVEMWLVSTDSELVVEVAGSEWLIAESQRLNEVSVVQALLPVKVI